MHKTDYIAAVLGTVAWLLACVATLAMRASFAGHAVALAAWLGVTAFVMWIMRD